MMKSPFQPFLLSVLSQVNNRSSWLINKEQAAAVMSCYTWMKRHTLICTQKQAHEYQGEGRKNKDMVIIFNRVKRMKHGANDLLNNPLKAF